MRKYIALIICGILSIAAFGQNNQKPTTHRRGIPAYRGVIERVQPNGDTLRIYQRGDERQHYAMTVDGWQILENGKGYICYATQDKTGKAVASRKKAHNEEKRCCCEQRWLRRHGIQKIEQ